MDRHRIVMFRGGAISDAAGHSRHYVDRERRATPPPRCESTTFHEGLLASVSRS